jgi:hypothetical protein
VTEFFEYRKSWFPRAPAHLAAATPAGQRGLGDLLRLSRLADEAGAGACATTCMVDLDETLPSGCADLGMTRFALRARTTSSTIFDTLSAERPVEFACQVGEGLISLGIVVREERLRRSAHIADNGPWTPNQSTKLEGRTD